MVQLSLFSLVVAAAAVSGAPLWKRIAQNIPDSTHDWEQACLAAGGGSQCNPLSVKSFTTLLIAAGPCEQQDAADEQIDLAKQLNNNADMIRLTQIFVQQPRNSPNSVFVPYCQKAPRNSELNGLFQCQFKSANPNVFQGQPATVVGGLKLGDPGTFPFGKTSANSPPGSCPANPSGPIADGTQLISITKNPGKVGSGNSVPTPTKATAPAATTTNTSSEASTAESDSSEGTSTSDSTSTSSDFHISNGQAAQALNAKFATLSADASCTDGDEACINGGFAQCVGGKFTITQCGAGTQCVVLPLVNKPGTSITCDSKADAEARISQSGATGGFFGTGAIDASSTTSVSESVAPESTPTTSEDTSVSGSSSSSSDFHLANAQAAQALNAKFATLSASTSCTDGEEACIDGGFAQCVGGQFTITQCGSGLKCVALPLVNKSGTSITCDTQADAVDRIHQSGATGGLQG